MIRNIFYDFDGVIMDSMALKLDSYCHAMRDHGFDRDDVNRIMCERAGTSRHKILVGMYEELAGKPMPDELFATALADFNEQDAASVAHMPFVPGSEEFVREINPGRFTAIVTGTPHDVIRDTAAHHGLTELFDVIRGTPDTKVQIVREEMARHGIAAADAVFIGDGRTDQLAAKTCGLRFIGVEGAHSSFDPAAAWKVTDNLLKLRDEFR